MTIIEQEKIASFIFTIRGEQVMLDYHLAAIYNVETKRLNEQVKRNKKRFPHSFMFQLNQVEWNILRSQIATTSNLDLLQSQSATTKRRTMPYVFTEQGVSMLSAVLNSETAIQVSIQIIQTFVNMRKFILNNASVFQRLDSLELKQIKTNEKIEQIFKALESGQVKPDKGIFFDGQIFDAWLFISDLVKSAKSSIVLIDNYVDETILTLFAKKKKGVRVSVYTKSISRVLEEDAKKFNHQFGELSLSVFHASHDRFLIIDEVEVYHIGASLKDLGKKWFAFSKMEKNSLIIIEKLKNSTKS